MFPKCILNYLLFRTLFKQLVSMQDEGHLVDKFRKPSIFSGGMCVMNFLLYGWCMQRDATEITFMCC